jgi:hypothetical protein
LRCRAFSKTGEPGKIVTQSYFIDESSTLPIVSLVTDPLNLWDEETGIYAKGNQWKDNNYNKAFYNFYNSTFGVHFTFQNTTNMLK